MSGLYRVRSGGKELEIARLQRQLAELTDEMFAEGLLDDQFTQLQQLQDESNPEFVGEVVELFFEDSEKLLEDLTAEMELEPMDFEKVDAHVHQFKGSSSSVGASRVKGVCVTFRNFCDEKDSEGCRNSLVEVKREFKLVKEQLERMLKLEEKILAKGGVLPFMMNE
eukprot:TRINITY_DN3237_c1_g3_i1.p1 TRINITY_DN3237_c1_g3~~TRINITY_DN3237_c1_g3_i1.p1  ORF type:complete len:167 (+),score=61.56 TRINITY_DN3237_c1_g3_i1:341-841(+)